METKTRNVRAEWQNLPVEEIATNCAANTISASVAMINVEGDFNFSTMVRNANFFGFSSVHYAGKKKWDKRGAVGTYNYTSVYYHKSESDFIDQMKGRSIVCVENNIPEHAFKTKDLFQAGVHSINLIDPVFVFGSENEGLSDEILGRADLILTLIGYGSVRSLNVGTCSGIVMGIYRSWIERDKRLAAMFPLHDAEGNVV